MGHPVYPLSQQIADTAAVHGYAWTRRYYRRRGLSPFEWRVLSGFPL